MRERQRESMAEVSGAVEIDMDQLERIEQGAALPGEEILLLLINHFGIRDDEALQLWDLAGYDRRDMYFEGERGHDDGLQLSKQPVVMVMGMDQRVVYSNGVHVSVDPSGVVLNFNQYAEPTQAPITISRVGMSHAQAEKVLETLQQALLRFKYGNGAKQLPAPNQNHKKPKN